MLPIKDTSWYPDELDDDLMDEAQNDVRLDENGLEYSNDVHNMCLCRCLMCNEVFTMHVIR